MNYKEFVELRKNAPKTFTVDTIRSFQYLQDLANLTRVNLDTWDMELFRNQEDTLGYSWIEDKLKINQIFFSEVERRAKEPQLPAEVT